MIESSETFLSFLASVRSNKNLLNSLLGADPEKDFVYYLAPLSNVIRIYQSGGILPRNQVQNYVDLSGTGVQDQREEKKLRVIGRKGTRSYSLHDCVNFFFNPLNYTYYQFRRNALIRSQAGDPWSQTVCMLELDVQKMLESDLFYWCVSNKNLASSGSRHAFEPAWYRGFDWEKIYSVAKSHTRDHLNDFRSAEWVVRPVEVDGERKVNTVYINRVLVLEKDFDKQRGLELPDSSFHVNPFSARPEFQVVDDPIEYDRKLVTSFLDMERSGVSRTCIINALKRILHIESEMGMNLTASFFDPHIAESGMHGAGHIVRVMFWVCVLAEASNQFGYTITDEEFTSALYAAFVHDLYRVNHEAESGHGAMAALKLAPALSNMLSEQALERCITAVRCHDQNQEPDDSDCVWKLLKDADSIDRGRFGAPDQPGGCNSKFLRLPILKNRQWSRDRILWSAYWLVRVTKYTSWKDNACENFVLDLLRSLNTVMNFDGILKPAHDMAREICLQVAGLRSEQAEFQSLLG